VRAALLRNFDLQSGHNHAVTFRPPPHSMVSECHAKDRSPLPRWPHPLQTSFMPLSLPRPTLLSSPASKGRNPSQRLGHFITDSKWSDQAVRRAAARYAIDEMVEQRPVEAWIIDDTGFLKQGAHSVGVKRQYTGSAGKITNCQVGVSLSVSTRTEHVPIDFELYLPKEWAEDRTRRKEARIPDQVQFATKPELALKMVDRALKDKVPKGVVLADEGYGNNGAFRAGVRARGLHYAVGINSTATVWVVDRDGGHGLVKWTPKEIAKELGRKRFRRTTWREGTNERLSARFAARRVVVGHDDGQPTSKREEQWLLMEWRDGEKEPAHFYLLTLARETSRKQMVRLVKERYRTERVYEDLKNELGLDHFEGRRFSGWHHHVSVALSCYAFIVAEKCRAFPPRGDGRVKPVRSTQRPERHFADSFITFRLAIARILSTWLPRCPLCLRSRNSEASRHTNRRSD